MSKPRAETCPCVDKLPENQCTLVDFSSIPLDVSSFRPEGVTARSLTHDLYHNRALNRPLIPYLLGTRHWLIQGTYDSGGGRARSPIPFDLQCPTNEVTVSDIMQHTSHGCANKRHCRASDCRRWLCFLCGNQHFADRHEETMALLFDLLARTSESTMIRPDQSVKARIVSPNPY